MIKFRKQLSSFALPLLMAVAGAALLTAVMRPIWYDEAWSIMVYSTLPYADIYSAYDAPNNHILFNMLMHFYLNNCTGNLPVNEAMFRVIPVLTSLLTIFIMFIFWRKRLGTAAACITVLSFSLSTPFIIYGTAVRGYMLSILLIIAGLEFLLRFLETERKRYIIFYFLSALAVVAVIPSNIFAFIMMTLIPTRRITASTPAKAALFKFAKKRLPLMLLPIAAFLLFYAPIMKKLIHALAANNGRLYTWSTVLHLYSGMMIPYLPLFSAAAVGSFIIIKRRKHLRMLPDISLISLIFITPLLIILLRRPAPFPRVFLQILPIWLYLAGRGVKHLFTYINAGNRRKKRGNNSRFFPIFPLFIAVTVIWGLTLHSLNTRLSALLTRQGSQDDFFFPFYMHPEFTPATAVEKLMVISGKKPGTVFLSQNIDFPSLLFYGKLKGVNDNFWINDYPGKKRIGGTPDADIYYIVVKNRADLSLLKKRFGIENVTHTESIGVGEVYGYYNRKKSR